MMKYRLIFVVAMMAVALAARSQTVVSGVVKDRQTGHVLSRVSISAEGALAHTVTNDDGRFVLRTAQCPKYIQLSHIGYKTRRLPLQAGATELLQVLMTVSNVQLDEVSAQGGLPALEAILRAAMSRIGSNYPQDNELVRCFYRETVRRGSRFIAVAEAVTEMFKTGYGEGPERDGVAIMKGRRLMSMRSRDTLGVKIRGGPVLPLMVDVAKNSDYLLNEEQLANCNLRLAVPARIDDRLHYVVVLQPKAATPYPMLGGQLYIDQESLTITRAELSLDVSDWRKASDYMLVSKPAGLRFRPKELTVTVAYTTDQHGVTRMSYVRNEMRFNCDWKRRLFNHTFCTVSEMVVTDRLRQGREARRPRGPASFSSRERFYDRVEYFDDPDFWDGYNIIEPTESLEHAIWKLKKNSNIVH